MRAVGGFVAIHAVFAAVGMALLFALGMVSRVRDIRRFGAHAASRSWATAKALEAFSRYYDIVYPNQQWTAARPLRRSAVWPRLSTLRAVPAKC